MKSKSLIPFRDMDDYFQRLFEPRRWPLAWPVEREFEWKPATDIAETDKEFVFKAELPGVKNEDVSVEPMWRAKRLSGHTPCRLT